MDSKGRNGKANNHVIPMPHSSIPMFHWYFEIVHNTFISVPSSPMTVTTNSLDVLAFQKGRFGDKRKVVVMETSELKCASVSVSLTSYPMFYASHLWSSWSHMDLP
jgi:hypothetical protein